MAQLLPPGLDPSHRRTCRTSKGRTSRTAHEKLLSVISQGDSTGEGLGSGVLKIWGPTPSRERREFCGLYERGRPAKKRKGKEEWEEKENGEKGIFLCMVLLVSVSFPSLLKPFQL